MRAGAIKDNKSRVIVGVLLCQEADVTVGSVRRVIVGRMLMTDKIVFRG